MNVLTIAGDKLAYSFFARAERQSKLRYLSVVLVLYAVAGLAILFFGEELFTLIYGAQWQASAKTFSYLGIYLFTHGALGLITNFLVTEHRFAGVYTAWAGWTVTFFACFMYDPTLPIAAYYLSASAVSFLLAACALCLTRRHSPPAALQGAV
jgi:O-antigen/teichoic acid export membrane protein